MDPFRQSLLEVWQEACRHIRIRESAGRIVRLLARHLPLEDLLVREFDPSRCALETVAVGSWEDGGLAQLPRTECSAREMKRLLAWCRYSKLWRRGRGPAGSEWAKLAPPALEGDVLAGGLCHEGKPLGVLLLLASPRMRFEAKHEAMLRALLEPFSVALENDHRLRELTALREASEADKRSLLARLGRKEITDTIIGAGAGLRPVMERVGLVSKSDVPVLLLGETGTGKEVVARAVHSGSPRASGPFIRVNCGAIPHELIDSHLFGHERGSFTGATETRKGWFERADGGTLFLDEIGELPLAAQVRLLRILQDGTLERVGGQESIKVHVRMVAATHRDLTAMVREARFREDLWYRIAVFTVLLPPLRERVQDIPALANHFAEKAAIRFGLPLRLPAEHDLSLLTAYSWPGNVRELGAVIDRAAILGNGVRLEVAQALGVGSRPAASARKQHQPPAAESVSRGTIVPLDAAMKQHIEAALAATHGRIEGPFGAARVLEVNPHTLRARMRKLGIVWRRFRSSAAET